MTNKFMIKLTNEFNEKRCIFCISSKDLTDYVKNKELIDKIIKKDNELESLENSETFEDYFHYGKIEISKMTYDEVLINADKLD